MPVLCDENNEDLAIKDAIVTDLNQNLVFINQDRQFNKILLFWNSQWEWDSEFEYLNGLYYFQVQIHTPNNIKFKESFKK